MPQNVIVFRPEMSLGKLIERFGTDVQREAAHDAATSQIALHGSPSHKGSGGPGIARRYWGRYAVRQPDPLRTLIREKSETQT